MNVIYSSKHFWILSYPEQQGFELFDKYHLRTLFLDGASAQKKKKVKRKGKEKKDL